MPTLEEQLGADLDEAESRGASMEASTMDEERAEERRIMDEQMAALQAEADAAAAAAEDLCGHLVIFPRVLKLKKTKSFSRVCPPEIAAELATPEPSIAEPPPPTDLDRLVEFQTATGGAPKPKVDESEGKEHKRGTMM